MATSQVLTGSKTKKHHRLKNIFRQLIHCDLYSLTFNHKENTIWKLDLSGPQAQVLHPIRIPDFDPVDLYDSYRSTHLMILGRTASP